MRKKLYRGLMTRAITKSVFIDTRAVNKDAARVQIANRSINDTDLEWEVDECSTPGEPYWGDDSDEALELVPESIRYEHDCEQCTLLGQYKEYDLYYCTKQGAGLGTVVARHGDEGREYASGPRTGLLLSVRAGWALADIAGLTGPTSVEEPPRASEDPERGAASMFITLKYSVVTV